MRHILTFIFVSLAFLPMGHAETEKNHDACIDTYLQSPVESVKAVGMFILDARDDVDYESTNQMTLAVRKAKRLKAWDKEAFLDTLNIAIVSATIDSMDSICTGKPWTMTKLTQYLIKIALPEYFKKNPDMAKDAYWKD